MLKYFKNKSTFGDKAMSTDNFCTFSFGELIYEKGAFTAPFFIFILLIIKVRLIKISAVLELSNLMQKACA